MHQLNHHHWFRYWLVTWLAPSHYLHQCWNIVNWASRNKLRWNISGNSCILIQENPFQNAIWKMVAILFQLQCVNWLRHICELGYQSLGYWLVLIPHQAMVNIDWVNGHFSTKPLSEPTLDLLTIGRMHISHFSQWYYNSADGSCLVKYMMTSSIKWKHFPRYWPFVWGIHWSPVNSPHKGQWGRALMFSLICT